MEYKMKIELLISRRSLTTIPNDNIERYRRAVHSIEFYKGELWVHS